MIFYINIRISAYGNTEKWIEVIVVDGAHAPVEWLTRVDVLDDWKSPALSAQPKFFKIQTTVPPPPPNFGSNEQDRTRTDQSKNVVLIEDDCSHLILPINGVPIFHKTIEYCIYSTCREYFCNSIAFVLF